MAVEIKIPAADLAQRLGKHFDAVVRRASLAVMTRAKAHIVNELIPNDSPPAVDRGLYRAGFQVSEIARGATLYNAAPHAAFVEHGVAGASVKPGKKMLEALTAWVIRKGIAKKQPGKAGKALQAAEARSIAWAIMVSLKKKGIFDNGKGLRHVEKATLKIPVWAREEIAREVKRLKL